MMNEHASNGSSAGEAWRRQARADMLAIITGWWRRFTNGDQPGARSMQLMLNLPVKFAP
jgi:hypothetical protein